MVSESWREKKKSASRWFVHSRVSLWYDKGITSVHNNAPELNEVVRRRPPIYHERPNLPDITFTALTETGRAESTIPVLKQRSYTGNKPVISSALTDTRCAALGVDGILKRLNATLGTSYSLGSKVFSLWRKRTLRSILKPYVERNDDFGTVYSHLRSFWYDYDVAKIEDALRVDEEQDTEMRKNVRAEDWIVTSDVPPRRPWIPRVKVISHAWVDEKDRVDVTTPINGEEWPVPMPKDADLDLIRIEMLNLGAEFAWLDVLCLRQEGGKGEDLRLEEWKLDVPTIGYLYQYASVVCYFNGLGRPLHVTAGYFESDRCWFRRAWTLQEITRDPIIGGETGDDVTEDDVRKKFDEQLARLREMRNFNTALEVVSEMQNRVSSKPVDKVAGLAYILQGTCIPIYNARMSDADAWEVLMDVMSPVSRSELFFYFPGAGNGRKYWRPSWQQILTMKYCLNSTISWVGTVKHDNTDEDYYVGYFIDSADVRGLDEGLEEEKPRQGEMFFKTSAGISCTFKIWADHAYRIPDGSYTVTSPNIPGPWVVGCLRENQEFKKLSVFCLADKQQINTGALRLEKRKISLC
ncbi:hypothetical protein IW261DRAFT_1336769 [Armillaria novae-zelandiae]|uniref:Heterokaryon incompatibility domain-containing protein n=1 Tax=Armillaria novae-zelandiae TaxID=153914 RepID=A0AA39TC06_9AGAR|nr:hypothetical protein IW261DRAFT_1336769 [Armillaria novae-zelandiae]